MINQKGLKLTTKNNVAIATHNVAIATICSHSEDSPNRMA
jgi:hypothetical protein